MPIEYTVIPYPDFKLHEIIEPDEFDFNNESFIKKIDQVIRVINQMTDGIGPGSSGADVINLTAIAPFTSTKLQTFLEEVISTLRSIDANKGSAFIGSQTIPGVTGSTVFAQLTSLKAILDSEKVRLDNSIQVERARITALQSDVTIEKSKIATLQSDSVIEKAKVTTLQSESILEKAKVSLLQSQMVNHNHDGRYMTRSELQPYLQGGYVITSKELFNVLTVDVPGKAFTYQKSGSPIQNGTIDESGMFVITLINSYTLGVGLVSVVLNGNTYKSVQNGGIVEIDGKSIKVSGPIVPTDKIEISYYAKSGSSSEVGVLYGTEQPLPTSPGILWFKVVQ